jgi:hypothetical protein
MITPPLSILGCKSIDLNLIIGGLFGKSAGKLIFAFNVSFS